ncbi:alpha-N-acetylglucosaminidase TIM-barrel domain-containing protein [Clostridium sp.]|uniref:alpha-N-acetylglucosaminidase TIM-barrel domain-containing protein n=1 Tax=Clostridium sp. TaxID=1506 RepID=UPI003F35B9EA
MISKKLKCLLSMSMAMGMSFSLLGNTTSAISISKNNSPHSVNDTQTEKVNIAPRGSATANSTEVGRNPSMAIDDNTSSLWAAQGRVFPSWVNVELDKTYEVEDIEIVFEKATAFQFDVSVSEDGTTWTKVHEYRGDEAIKNQVINYTGLAKYVKLDLIDVKNNSTIWPAVAEIKVFSNIEVAPPPVDGNNIAQGKIVYGRDDNKTHKLSDAVDGKLNTYWDGGQYPSYLEIDLENVYSLDTINIVNYEAGNRYYEYSVYGSVDGVNFDKIAEKTSHSPSTWEGDTFDLNKEVEARFIRVLLEYGSANEAAHISEVRVYGEESGQTGSPAPEINIQSFEDTEYAAPVTTEDTINEVNGIVERRLGAEYISWFDFEVAQSLDGLDYYEITNGENGKIKIKGNNGVSIATGLNYYLKYYCKVNIAQNGAPVTMPETAPAVDGLIRKDTPYETRYAYNYCTLSYSMAFWNDDEWQTELDWLALSGVNLVLDLTAQDEVWRRFLGKLGYDITEIKNWLVGPGYMAWQHMANMSTFGGPLPDQWFEARTDLARTMQRKMKTLGMEPVLQGYSGMVPTNIKDKRPDVEIIAQGTWNAFQRPSMLKTTSAEYEEFSRLFYESQEEVFGKDATNYYATDPFHEGGITGGMSKGTVYRETLDSMLEYDNDAIWVVQSWQENPTQNALDGVGTADRDHLLVLDLYSELDPRWPGRSNIWGYQWKTPEFDGTPWVWNMLNNFGGRMGLHGQLETLATEIPKAYKATSTGKQSKMKGIGITPEATGTNPVIFDLMFEMAWTEEEVDIDTWLRNYVERRYGKVTDNAYEAWLILNETAYKRRTDYHEGAGESIINARPKFNVNSASTWGSAKISYNKMKLEEAVKLLLEDYDTLKDSPGYLYDLTDCLRQVLANSSQEYYKKFTSLYNTGDKEGFIEYADKFLELIKLQEELLSTNENFLLGTWIEDAKEIAFDDFSTDMFEINARALLTTWGAVKQSEGGLHDYSNRQWSGLTGDFYLKRWEMWIDTLKTAIETGTTPQGINWFEWEWDWVRSNNEFTTKASDLDVKTIGNRIFEEFSVSELNKPDPLAIPQGKMKATATSSEPSTSEGPAEYVLDGDSETIWHTKYSGGKDELPQSITLDLGDNYVINKFSYLPRQNGTNGNITSYDLQVSTDGVNFTTIKSGTLANDASEKIITFDDVTASYVRLVAKSGAGGYATAAELNVYKSDKEIVVEKPSNLMASEIESNSANITWSAPKETTGLVGYLIYKDGKLLTEVTASTTSYNIENLKSNSIYGFKVVSKYSNGQTSNPISLNLRTQK